MTLGVSSPGILIAFAAGMLSFLSPCVLPLVPGYLSLMSGVEMTGLRSDEGAVATGVDTRRVLRSTLLFVAGFTVVFVVLGATASALGQALREHQVVLNRVAGVVIIVMGLAMAGLVVPGALLRERRIHLSPARLGAFAPPVMGMAFAFGWTPCIGPVLAAVLALAATEGTLAQGVLLLLAYSLGLGVPFVAAGLALNRLTGAFAWFRRHYRAISLVSGLLLAGFGVLLLTNRVTRVSSWLVDIMGRLGLDSLTAI
ncbi:MAG: cytochrome c biogenesis protein CcdA [Actinomycetota bacterium]|nr:cytochrome c biogenesis protein CcdA [Actinomycetota bacterium]MDQ3574359.1 cytochrome c biogenesis protein CcdA [Actinomycetota bacterium]